MYISDGLQGVLEDNLKKLLSWSRGIFAWTAQGLAGIPARIAVRPLRLGPISTTSMSNVGGRWLKKKVGVTPQEIRFLLRAGFTQEVQYPKWLANAVLAKKSSRKWRMCVDFKDHNKACPKDS